MSEGGKKKTDSLPRLAQGQGEVTKQAPRLGHQEMRRILLKFTTKNVGSMVTSEELAPRSSVGYVCDFFVGREVSHRGAYFDSRI